MVTKGLSLVEKSLPKTISPPPLSPASGRGKKHQTGIVISWLRRPLHALSWDPAKLQVKRARDHMTKPIATLDKDTPQRLPESYAELAGGDVGATVTSSPCTLGKGLGIQGCTHMN